jgi:hypothetical protein
LQILVAQKKLLQTNMGSFIQLSRQWIFSAALSTIFCVSQAQTAHVWEMQELSFTAENNYSNPYTDVKIWVELSGPGFNKKVYGFWDGGDVFHVRLVATQPGVWSWKSGSSPNDPGLTGKTGSFTAIDWTEEEKHENPLRRGFIKASENKHALTYADGTPYFIIGDTWFSCGADRFKWYDDTVKRPIGPTAGFKDYVRYRKAQGYNWINMIAAFPNWKTDDSSYHMRLYDSARTTLRSAWMEFGKNSAKNMDNEGGRPFFFPGKVPGYENYFPNMDSLNPEYFKYIDRKIAYLNANGFIPFIEALRRDVSLLWQKYHQWPESYSRYLQYFYARYHAYNAVLGPVHLDIISGTISPDDFTKAIKDVEEEYGPLPFGNLLSANANPSTFENFGEDSWVTLHQIGNKREHNFYWYLTQIFYSKYPKPSINGEPYYAGYKDARGAGIGVHYHRGADGGTKRDSEIIHSAMYGSFLSGGLAGHVYGAEGIWGGDIEPSAPTHMWDAFQWESGAHMKHLRTFAFSIGDHYQELEPMADLVSPNKTHDFLGYDGWAYCSRTPDRNIFLVYFEKGCPQSEIRGAKMNSIYRAQWFNPREGTWSDVDANEGRLASSNIGTIVLPPLPGETDWGLKLVYERPANLDPLRPVAQVPQDSRKVRLVKKYWPHAASAVAGAVGLLLGLIILRKLGWMKF